MLYKPVKACNMILACAVLHNIALANGVPLDDPLLMDDPMPIEPLPANPYPRALQRRAEIICRF